MLISMDFKHIQFNDCGNEVNFSGTSLNGIDLSNSTFEQLFISIKDLEGCKVSSEQAIGFALLLSKNSPHRLSA